MCERMSRGTKFPMIDTEQNIFCPSFFYAIYFPLFCQRVDVELHFHFHFESNNYFDLP